MTDYPDAKPCACDAPAIAIEVLGAYDGALFEQCGGCGSRWHRYPVGHWLRPRAERHIGTPDPARLAGDHTG